MFKFAVFLFATACYAAVLDKEDAQTIVPIISEESVVEHDGNYHYKYETGDGTVVQETGEVEKLESGKSEEVVSGGYKYVGPDGVTYEVTYEAGKDGFVPVGDHLPVSPPIPGPIARALKFIEEHPQVVEDVPTEQEKPKQ